MSINKVIESLEKGKSFFITSHIDLEGDALGSELALAYLLRELKKAVFVYNTSSPPSSYRFLPLLHFLNRRNEGIKYSDTIIVLDCSDLGRIGRVREIFSPKKNLINIDHHPDNNLFGTVNWVEPKASAVGELIYQLFKKLSIPLVKEVALCLYTAILTDTGGFQNENTTFRTHKIVAELLRYGINPRYVFERIYEMHSFARMRLLGLALSQLQVNKKKGFAWVSISQEMLRKTKANLEDVEGFIEMIRSMEGIKLAILFQEIERNKIKVGFRSREGIDAGRFARIFGGGGHFTASGCVVKGSLKEVEEKVLDSIRRGLF